MNATNSYGLWMLVVLNSAIFILFAFSFIKPKTTTDWHSLGAFSAFVVALFTEMYGFPLTIYLLSGWLQSHYPQLDLLAHDNGHLWHTLLGFEGNPHFDPLHLLSYLVIIFGFLLLSSAWRVLFQAQQRGELATTGWYARMRHPQYSAFMLIMFGFLLQWPTIPTLVLFPVLVVVYRHLALCEEQAVETTFGEQYRAYRAATPAFIPRFKTRSETGVVERTKEEKHS
ncbi:MAG TPA: isoprenylcysteine carboxylmethyltransferase family protein [Motiliproteus sp.]